MGFAKVIDMKRDLLIFVMFGVSVACLCSCRQQKEKEERTPVSVEVMTIDTLDGVMTRTYVGEVEANESVSLSFPTGGKVEKVLVHEGDAVHAGQRLATVDKSTAQNAYNSAKAQLDQAEDGYKRLKRFMIKDRWRR